MVRSDNMKNKKIKIVLIGILVIILLIVGLYFYGLTAVSRKEEKVTFVVNSGAGKRAVIDKLYESNLIKSKIASYIYITLNEDIMIQAGTYELDRSYSTKEILNVLNKGKVVNDVIVVTFIEGKKLTDFVKIISDKFGYSEEEILNVLNDQEYLKELINKYEFLDDSILNSDLYYALEGYLFPASYEFYKTSSIKVIIEKMLDKTANILDNYGTSILNSGYSVHEILTIASIIENETMFQEDRSVVSQVIKKRLALNMSLGMDVTTYYGVQKSLSETLTKSDLENENAYNTRRTSFIGLPVGPICNPSEASIEAALNPSRTEYIYFYADIKTGKLYFAETYSEFQGLIQKYS